MEKEKNEIVIGTVSKIPTSGLTRFRLGITLSDGTCIKRTLVCSIYDQKYFSSIIKGNSLKERKGEALRYFESLELEDVNVMLVRAYFNKLKNSKIYDEFQSVFRLIEVKGDCADFILTPLLAIYRKYEDNFPNDFHEQMKKLALEFRYWIDEPGNDVMWYFSENHALLFHASQYLAGYMYPDECFIVSNRSGKDQYEIGKKRLVDWFNKFMAEGFSEWNSTTYFPIDMIGFFSLYIAAPDEEIKVLAKQALDYTFKLIAINYHDGTMASTYGRVYEHNLKAMELGEISSVLAIAWNNGYFNNALRVSALFCMSDYEPNSALTEYFCDVPNTEVQAEYIQGDNQAYTYLFKTKEYSLASVVDYRAYEKGHQQHLDNISLGDCTMLWINNPGEAEYSGENRPSFWAGNDCMPKLFQYKNILFGHYSLEKSNYPYIHLYLPFWDLDDVIEEDHWLFIRKKNKFMAVFFSNPYERVYTSSVYGREVRAMGEDQAFFVKLSSVYELETFENFMDSMKNSQAKWQNDVLSYEDPQFGSFRFNPKLELNGEEIAYLHDNYKIFINRKECE